MKGATTEQRQRRYRSGLAAEATALALLTLKGYVTLACRYKSPVGEIDLVMRQGRVLVFVEVKRRVGLDDAAFAIHARNQERIRNAALHFLSQHPDYVDHDMRFDAILIAPRHLPQHLENAF